MSLPQDTVNKPLMSLPQDTVNTPLMSQYDEAMKLCVELECGWYYALDSVITLTDTNVFKDLMYWNKSVITTQLTQPGQVMNIMFLL